jgi:hypothetical protein
MNSMGLKEGRLYTIKRRISIWARGEQPSKGFGREQGPSIFRKRIRGDKTQHGGTKQGKIEGGLEDPSVYRDGKEDESWVVARGVKKKKE